MNIEVIPADEDKNTQHVVFGATGAYGYAIVRKLVDRDVSVRAVVRNEEKASKLLPNTVEIVNADLMSKESVSNACKDASVVYVANNYKYKDWTKYFMGSVTNILRGVGDSRPILVFPGNVYGYGEFQYSPVDELHPLGARSSKGRLRNEIESLLLEFHRKGRIDLVMPRFADFYGPNVTNDLYGAMFKNALNNRAAIWPLNADLAHNFTYIDDAAEATMLLVWDPNSYGKVFHVSGNVTTARKFIEGIFRDLDTHPKIRVLSRTLLRVMSPFYSNVRGLLELLYEYERPYNIDDSRFTSRYGSFRHTPYGTGIRNTLQWFRRNIGRIERT